MLRHCEQMKEGREDDNMRDKDVPIYLGGGEMKLCKERKMGVLCMKLINSID